MQIVIITALIVIVSSLAYIGRTYKWLFVQQELLSSYITKPLIVERVYRAIDFKSQFQYIMKDDFANFQFFLRPEDKTRVVIDDEHKKYILKEYTQQLAEQMLNAGVVQVNEVDDYMTHPYIKRMQMKVKVYKPEHE